MAAIGAIGGITSGIIGGVESQADRDQASAQINAAIQAYKNIGVPPAEALQVALQHYQSAGQLTPAMEQAFQQQQTQLNNVVPNAQDKQAQVNALQSLQQMGNNGGELLSDKATLNTDMANTTAQSRGAREAILSNAASHGQLGSGQSLAAELDSQQSAANQSQSNALSVDGQAQQRALTALMNSGQLGGQLESQDYNQQAAKAQAQDAINNFNVQNRQGVSNTNTGIANNAQAANLANAQAISNANTGTANEQAVYNAGTIQQNYQDQMQQAAGETGQMDTSANQSNLAAQNAQNTASGVGQGLAQAGTAYQNNQNFQQYMNAKYPSSTATPTVASTSDDPNQNQPTDYYGY